MSLISVAIPFYQKQPGILRRAISSVLSQNLPAGWAVEIVVVDDGSPIPAVDEVRDLAPGPAVSIRILQQVNRGVTAARRRLLAEISPDADLIAWLDSDDLWSPDHLARAVAASTAGFDMVFCDNSRAPFHESYLAVSAPKTRARIESRPAEDGVVALDPEEFQPLLIEEFPSQFSSLVHRADFRNSVGFDHRELCCGEDLLFILGITLHARRIGYIPDDRVTCGQGVNVFYGQFDWDSPNFFKIKLDQIRCHAQIQSLEALSAPARAVNRAILRRMREDYLFHLTRAAVKAPAVMVAELQRARRLVPDLPIWAAKSAAKVVLGYPLGLYRPSA